MLNEYIAAAGIGLLALIFLVVALTRKEHNDRTILVWLAVVLFIVATVQLVTVENTAVRWQWMLGALPSLVLASHGAFLYYVRSKVVPKANEENQQRMVAIARSSGDEEGGEDELSYSRLLRAGERYFSAQALLLRYGVPAVLLLGVALCLSNVITRWAVHYFFYAYGCATTGDGWCAVLGPLKTLHVETSAVPFLPAKSLIGAAYGLAGAYAYVLLYLGKRSFRLDITPGAATWCTITMAVGPVLAGFLGPFVLDDKPAWATGQSIPNVSFANVSLLFLAGFSPRFIVETLEESGRRLLTDASKAGLQPRTMPLTQVRGMTRSNMERLEEEGIDDVSQLAMADPYRLLRNTSFDKRQILNWMDSALLMVSLPEAFPALERRGVTGAMSLVWYGRAANRDALKALAVDARLSETVLLSVGQQLAADRQQKLIRILYVLDDGETSEPRPQEATAGAE